MNQTYFNGLAGGKLQWVLAQSLVLATDVSYRHFVGFGDGFNQNVVLWNAGLGYTFLKNKATELRLSVFDILRANTSINRAVTETYIEDNQAQIMQPIFLLTYT